MSSIFLAVIARLSIRELNKENFHCVSCTLILAVSKCDKIFLNLHFMAAQQYCSFLCLQYKMVVSVERIDVCLEVTEE